MSMQGTALMMAAGTGGHVIPGLAIAQTLIERQWSVQWLGTMQGIENKLVPAAGIALNSLQFAGLRGKGALGVVKGVWQLARALIHSIKVIRRVKPDVVVGMGGYVCVPGAWAAKLMGVPIVLVNADADVLMSNRSLAGIAKVVCCGFDGGAAQLKNAVVTGNPVRSSVVNVAPPSVRYSQPAAGLKVLIVGGSLGAQVLNTNVPLALELLSKSVALEVMHQTGTAQVKQVEQSYAKLNLKAHVLPFIDDMAAAYTWADVLICRAGAVTVSELCAAGVPAVLVPFLASTTHHQAGNAKFLADAGAGIHVPQAQLSPQSLAEILKSLDRPKLLAMANAAKALGKPDATQRVADIVEQQITKKTL